MNKYQSKKTGRVVVMNSDKDTIETHKQPDGKGVDDTFTRIDTRIVVPTAAAAAKAIEPEKKK